MHSTSQLRTQAKAAVRALPYSAIERIAAFERLPAFGMRRRLMKWAHNTPGRALRLAAGRF